MTFEPWSPNQRAFYGYGRSRLPSALDDAVQAYVDGLRRGGPAEVSEQARDVLSAYAERMASLAVRERREEPLERALVALVAAGLDRGVREALMVMPLVENSARRLGLDADALLKRVAGVVGGRGAEALHAWLRRSPEDRSLAAMGFVESEDQDGFRYRRSW